jgi:ribosomal subunit interface protein
MNIRIQGTHFHVSDEFRVFVQEKLEDAFRGLGDTRLEPVSVDIELDHSPSRRRKGNLFRVEANVSLPRTSTIRVEETAESMTRAVVQMKHTLTRELREWRERSIEDKRRLPRSERADALAEPPQEEGESEADVA